MSRPRRSDRDAILAETRQRLLTAAIAEIARHGYDGANVDRISLSAGFAKGTFYNHFSSKRELMFAIIDEVSAAHIAYVATRVHTETDPRRRMQRFFQAGFAFVEQHPLEARLLITTLYGSDIEFNERLFRAYQPMFAVVAEDILLPGVQQDIFHSRDVPCDATLVMTVYLGTSAQRDENGKPYLDPNRVAEFVTNALQPQPTSHTPGVTA